MQNKVKTISFQGQNIYVGIDVHLKSWKVTIMLDHSFYKTFSQDPEPGILSDYLHRNFPGGNYCSAYEAGFCGFSVHRELEKYGINNIVVNPADVPTTDKERKQKEEQEAEEKRRRKAQESQTIEAPSGQKKGPDAGGGSKKQKAQTKLQNDRKQLGGPGDVG